jgi:hypothetical protein
MDISQKTWEELNFFGKKRLHEFGSRVWHEELSHLELDRVLLLESAGVDVPPFHDALRHTIECGLRIHFVQKSASWDVLGRIRGAIKNVVADCRRAEDEQSIVSVKGDPLQFRVRKRGIGPSKPEKIGTLALPAVGRRNWDETRVNLREAYQEHFAHLPFYFEREDYAINHFGRNYALVVANDRARICHLIGHEGQYGRMLLRLLFTMMEWPLGPFRNL